MTNKTTFIFLGFTTAIMVATAACSRDHRLGSPSDTEVPDTGVSDTDTLVSNCNLAHYYSFDSDPLPGGKCKQYDRNKLWYCPGYPGYERKTAWQWQDDIFPMSSDSDPGYLQMNSDQLDTDLQEWIVRQDLQSPLVKVEGYNEVSVSASYYVSRSDAKPSLGIWASFFGLPDHRKQLISEASDEDDSDIGKWMMSEWLERRNSRQATTDRVSFLR